MSIPREPDPEYFREWQYREYLSASDCYDEEQDSAPCCALCGEAACDDPALLYEKNLRQVYCCRKCLEWRMDEDQEPNLSK